MIQGIKEGLLNYKTRKFRENNKFSRKTVEYNKAWDIGILYGVDGLKKHEQIKDFVKILEKDNKKVEVLTFLGKDKENIEFRYNFFTVNDFTFWGDLGSESVIKFTEKKFDFLLCLDFESNIYMQNVLARSQAKSRIGSFRSGCEDFFELMIKIKENSDIQELIDQMYHYIKIIKCPEN